MIDDFDLNKEAIEYFNNSAQELLLLLKPYKLQEKGNENLSSISHTYSEDVSDKIIGIKNIMSKDGLGNIKSRHFKYGNGFIGLADDSYQSFIKLVKALLKKRKIEFFLSQKYLENIIFEWFEREYKGIISKETTFIQYFEKRSKAEIKNYKISIPLIYISIHKPFQLGNVQYDFLNKEYFDSLVNIITKNKTESETLEDIEKRVFNLRKEYQGIVLATMNINAEREKAIEKTIEIVDYHIKLFKCFSTTTFLPEIPTYFDRKGHASIPMTYVLLFEAENPIEFSWIDENKDFDFMIDNETIESFSTLGYTKAFELINKDKRSELENTFINMISLFSKSISSIDFQDKLVYSLVALEILLLKNDTEPIQNSVGIRLAFLTRKDVDERRDVIKIVKECYKIRSSYIHHGKIRSEYILLQQLQLLVWQSIINLIRSIDRFKNQTEFVEYIEGLILK